MSSLKLEFDIRPGNAPSAVWSSGYEPQPIKMLKVEEPVKPEEPVNKPENPIKPLPIDTTETPEPREPIAPEDIQPTPRDEGGESGSSPMRSKLKSNIMRRLRNGR